MAKTTELVALREAFEKLDQGLFVLNETIQVLAIVCHVCGTGFSDREMLEEAVATCGYRLMKDAPKVMDDAHNLEHLIRNLKQA